MESRDKRDSDSHEPEQDTSHLSTRATARKNPRKLLVLLVVLLVVVAVVAAGLYLYKVNVLDPQAKKEAAALNKPKPSPTPKRLKPEEQMTQALVDGVNKERAELEKGDDTTALKNSTQAAISVGGNIDESSLQQYKD